MPGRRIPLTAVLAAVLAVLSLTAACGGSDGPSLPGGPELVRKSAEAMRAVTSVAFALETEGSPAVPVKKATGRLSGTGDADGTIQLSLMGTLQEIQFVLLGETVHFKGVTGGFQKMPRSQLATIYDPSAILDPDRGVVQLMSGAVNPRTEAAEKVDGSDAYKVSATLPHRILVTMVPGLGQDVNGTLWIDRATSRLLRADLPMDGGKVTVAFHDYGVPVRITAPAG
ncbi:LppX_LprAFG lipoprotein [Streptosporangium sandarakinum]|uniref:Lipoprotein LprG n=1 Tax=Streptosporangium sandarakinum TaxID=1260955 RepID=A0A852UTH9_9ACTN|nr:LppX_LprAFG lipoprotein [Streptosporangium sandarakinum]NYF38573.1 lipoprotein LprG [Streptosporangium sandarakinum]